MAQTLLEPPSLHPNSKIHRPSILVPECVLRGEGGAGTSRKHREPALRGEAQSWPQTAQGATAGLRGRTGKGQEAYRFVVGFKAPKATWQHSVVTRSEIGWLYS